jgi:hypothetical protein
MIRLITAQYRLWILHRAVERARDVAEAYLQFANALVRYDPNEENLFKQREAGRKLGRLRTHYARLGIRRDVLRDRWRQYLGQFG